ASDAVGVCRQCDQLAVRQSWLRCSTGRAILLAAFVGIRRGDGQANRNASEDDFLLRAGEKKRGRGKSNRGRGNSTSRQLVGCRQRSLQNYYVKAEAWVILSPSESV